MPGASQQHPTARRVAMLVSTDVFRDPRVFKEAQTLANSGHAVKVFCFGAPPRGGHNSHTPFEVETQLESPYNAYVNRAATRVRRSKGSKGAPASISSPSPSGLKNLARSVHVLIGFRLAIARLKRHAPSISAFAPEIIHAHDLDALLAATWMNKKLQLPLIYDSHELFSEMGSLHPLYRRWLRRAERSAIRKAKAVITVSSSIASQLSSWYEIAPPMVVRNVPDCGAIEPREGSGPLRFLYSGGVVRGRGVESLIEAFLALSSTVSARLFLMITGSEVARIREMIPSKSERVTVVPAVAPERVVEASSEYDVGIISFLATSLNNKLCLPNKLFE
jgi:glycosyltransferase involved in cell wall biosynthesis